jgi:hypothetical protein
MGAAANREGFQVIWGTFLAFDRQTDVDLREVPDLNADGDDTLFREDGAPRCPGAVAEIVAFDSSSVIVTSSDAELHRRIRAYFPEARPMPNWSS